VVVELPGLEKEIAASYSFFETLSCFPLLFLLSSGSEPESSSEELEK
jgi:uncharacterized BrkB/YihY/UPF0761 family membrane protein